MIESLERLYFRLSESSALNENDKKVLNDIASELSIQHDGTDNLQEINSSLDNQISIEANVAYLFSVYNEKQKRIKRVLQLEEANVLVKISPKKDGYRISAKEIEAIVRRNPDVKKAQEDYDKIECLFEDLDKLYWLVIGRREMLNQLSNNFRREWSTNEKHY